MGLFDNVGSNVYTGFAGWNPIQSVADAGINVANTVGNNRSWWESLFGGGGTKLAGGLLGGLGQIGGLATGIMQGLTGLQQMNLSNRAMNLANKQFGFQTDLANRNLINQVKLVNNAIRNAASVAANMVGGKDSYGHWGFDDPAVRKKYLADAQKQMLDEKPIKV